MDEAEAQRTIAAVVERLRGVGGVAALALGGSRATGAHSPSSDIDIGLYYRDPDALDLPALRIAVAGLDDQRRRDALTPIGGWGVWINGGGWLVVDGASVDLLYRDVSRIERAVEDAVAGRFETVYQWGHPHGFLTTAYAAEVATCQPLWDPHGLLADLKASLVPYPPRLRAALTNDFTNEAAFFVAVARHGLPRRDVAYTAGCLFRVVACLAQALFALNERFVTNEKGATARAATLPLTIPDLKARVDALFADLTPNEAALGRTLDDALALVEECRALVRAHMPASAPEA